MIAPQELLRLATRDLILDNTTKDEHIASVEDQIRDPFDSSDINYFKKLSKMVTGQDEMDELCNDFIISIQDVYDNLEIDLSEYDQRLETLFSAIYKFFVKSASRMMQIFIHEFIFNNKNRKGLVATFMTAKMPTYPKEQYGKKEYYVLITKLRAIVDEIFEGDDITLRKFINYISRSDKCPIYMKHIDDALENGWIVDKGVVSDMYRMFKKSDEYRPAMNKLEMDITSTFIIPYLEETGMISVRYAPIEEIPEESDDDEETDDD